MFLISCITFVLVSFSSVFSSDEEPPTHPSPGAMEKTARVARAHSRQVHPDPTSSARLKIHPSYPDLPSPVPLPSQFAAVSSEDAFLEPLSTASVGFCEPRLAPTSRWRSESAQNLSDELKGKFTCMPPGTRSKETQGRKALEEDPWQQC